MFFLFGALTCVPGSAWAQDAPDSVSQDHPALAEVALQWLGLLGRFGELGEMAPLERSRRGSFDVVAVLGTFERSERTLQVSFDGQGRVAGFVVVAARR